MAAKNATRLGAFIVALLLVGARAGLPARAGDNADRPRLVVLIVVDQLRADYLYRWYPHFVRGGFKRLMDGGAYYENAYYSYGTSTTAP